jgi:chitin disaccharide deacetylase
LRKVIITGDDFGLAEPVNEAIEESHRGGILTAASLMVGAEAAADAIERARRLPNLKVGLHLVLVEGRPVLGRAAVPGLVGPDGEFSTRLVLSGFRYFFLPRVRKQLEAETRAQFEAFRRTGLVLDHVNAHNHMHLHPTILGLILKVGREYGLKAVRFPNEPPLRSWRASRRALGGKVVSWTLLSPWLWRMRRVLRRARMRSNAFIFGMAESGAMTTALSLSYLRRLPRGVTEIYFHPATRRCPQIDRTMPEYRHEDEFRALTSRELADALASAGIKSISFSDLAAD